MTKRKVITFFLSIMFIMTGCAQAQNNDFKDRIQKIVKSKKWEVSDKNETASFCKEVLNDLDLGQFEVIKPFVIADTYDDPAFSDIRQQCPDLRMPYALYHYQAIEACRKNFQGFIANFDNNLENGDEFLLRCEKIVPEKTDWDEENFTGKYNELSYDDLVSYRVANLESCKELGYTTARGYNYRTNEDTAAISGPIMLNNTIYILSITDATTEYAKTKYTTYIGLKKFRKIKKKHDGSSMPVCGFKFH